MALSNREFRELWESGMATAQIAERTGLTEGGVRSRAIRMGLAPRGAVQAVTIDPVELGRLWGDKGLTLDQIAVKLQVSRDRVRMAADELGLPRRHRGVRRSAMHDDDLRRMWGDRSLSLEDIAARVGFSRGWVVDHSLRLGLGPRHDLKRREPPPPREAPLPRPAVRREPPKPAPGTLEATGGRYADLRAYAEAQGITCAVALQRWHRLGRPLEPKGASCAPAEARA